MSLAPSYNLDVEIFKKKNCMCICVYKSDNAGGQCVWKVAGDVQHAQQVHCMGGIAGGFHFQTKTETLFTESVNLFKKLLSTGLFTYTIQVCQKLLSVIDLYRGTGVRVYYF